jgi:O-acetyl-ADP-ribose deacetylase (regulator of RNase III)
MYVWSYLLDQGQQMITYHKGDATQPVGVGTKYIIHVCNSVGGWGKGFVNVVSRRWSSPEAEYRAWFGAKQHPVWGEFTLGNIQVIRVEPNIRVVNMIAQTGYGYYDKSAPPIRYPALAQCLAFAAAHAKIDNASIHAPRIGCGLAGGTWDVVEQMLDEAFKDVAVNIYDLE